MNVIGLMSGTSTDGIDAALLEIDGEPDDPSWNLLGFRTFPYRAERRAALLGAPGGSTADLCHVHVMLGSWLGEAAQGLCDELDVDIHDVDLIGSHGHTVWHQPRGRGWHGSLQIGDPAAIAARTGVDVISDFRAADVAAGGEGAPLVPWADRVFFGHPERTRALQNLGGIGNVTWVPPRGDPRDTVAFDTGPANALLDLVAERASGGTQRLDVDGRFAAQGTPDEALLERLLDMPFFRRSPPKSTGREMFGAQLVDRLAKERELVVGQTPEGWRDLMATLVRLTAASIGRAYREWILPLGVDEVFLTGGGERNPVLRKAIASELGDVPVRPGSELPIPPEVREAAAFAALAWAHHRGVPANVPGATGARRAVVLGSRTPGVPRDAGG